MAEFFDWEGENLNDSHEPTVAKEGEYTIKLKDWKTDDEGHVIRLDSSDKKFMLPLMEVIDCEGSEFMKEFTHFLRLPSEEMTAKDNNKAKWNLKIFFESFGIDYQGRMDFSEVAEGDYTADVILGVQDNDEYGDQNYIKKFVSGA